MNSDCEVCILAGGRSARMGRDKSRLRLGRRTLLGHARAVAIALGLPVRVIRRDRVARCGPLGGIYTALVTTRHAVVLFLSCDMPFLTPPVLRRTLRALGRERLAVFQADPQSGVGFPFALRREALGLVRRQIRSRQFSLQHLAGATRARRLPVPAKRSREFLNVNTPAELTRARLLRRRNSDTAGCC